MLHNTDKNNTKKNKKKRCIRGESTAAARDVLILCDGATEMHASRVRLCRRHTVL